MTDPKCHCIATDLQAWEQEFETAIAKLDRPAEAVMMQELLDNHRHIVDNIVNRVYPEQDNAA